MGSVTSALTRTRNALVKVGSEPEKRDTSQSAPESAWKRSQAGRQLSEVLSRADSGGLPPKKTSEGQQSCEFNSQVYTCPARK